MNPQNTEASQTASRPVRDLFDLTGKVALVTGGSRGLGKEMALGLAEAGAAVVITARREQWLTPAAADLAGRGFDCLAVTCDVTQPDQVEAAVQQALARHGRLDILVNNAGITWGAPAAEMPLDRFRAVLDVNVAGAFLMAQAAGRQMATQGGGKIVNVSSIMGLQGTPPEVVAAIGYSASKGALIALTRQLAAEWARYRITVNAIAPGFFPTRMSEHTIRQHETALLERIPLGRFGQPDDIKALAVFLAAPASDYCTGQVFVLDGGMTAW